jgi:peptidoglycan/xylan/chitin deacetylase (PgdA/CDA1 family)
MLAHFALKLLGKLAGKNKLSILIYHGVLASFDPMRPNEPTISSFSWQMAVLNKYFVPLALSEALALLQAGTLPANAVCVTFDDGYKNNLEIALPILQQYAIPATVFVATGFSQGENMWNDRVIQLFSDKNLSSLDLTAADLGVRALGDWPERKQLAVTLLKKLKYLTIEKRLEIIAALYAANGGIEATSLMMTPQEVKQLSDAGVEIGAHTVNHPILKVLPAAQQAREIQESKSLLEQWTGKPVTSFAYPNGQIGVDLDEQTVGIVKEQGFDCAVVTDWGTSTATTSPWMLRRFTPWDKSANKFHMRLLKNQFTG